jgi:uncharacterized membrane protein YedE/YeeE
MAATEFTPIASALGGALIGASAVALMLFNGRIAGISGIAGRLLPPYGTGLSEAVAFLAGLIAAPLLVEGATGQAVAQTITDNVPLLVAGGLLVGFGTIYGGGCTSGHGVCGLSRLSLRSLVATLLFMATAIATVFIARHVIGAPA